MAEFFFYFIISFIIGVAATICGGIILSKISARKKLRWSDVNKLILTIKDQLLNDKYQPDLIVGIGRGGAIVGSLLSGAMGHVPLIVIDRKYTQPGKERNVDLFERIKIETEFENALLVSGDIVTGKTMAKYFEHFKKNLDAKNVRTAGLWVLDYSFFKVDYIGMRSFGPLLKMPWMITQDYRMDQRSEEETQNL